jgi:hypothetical protein
LLLLRTFLGFDSGELIDNIGIFCRCALALVGPIDEVAHSGGLLGCNYFRVFLHVHKLIWTAQFFRTKPTTLLLLLKRKQVRLLKRSLVTTPSGA